MKARFLSLVSLFLLGSVAIFAQDKTEKVKVYGNCGMCETRIEKAATDLDGVTSAEWDKETKMMEVKFDSKMVDVHKVHMAVAKVGHDTDMHKAQNEVYDALPGCCKYERPKEKSKKHMHKYE
jgi:copper chaperone CopZ